SYPELVLCATRHTIQRNRGLAQNMVDALVYGYDFTLVHPSRSAKDLEQRVPGLDPKLVSAQLNALLPAFAGPNRRVGQLDRTRPAPRATSTSHARTASAPPATRAPRCGSPSPTACCPTRTGRRWMRPTSTRSNTSSPTGTPSPTCRRAT